MDRIRLYLSLQLDAAEMPINALLGSEALFPLSLLERTTTSIEGRRAIAPPYAKIGGAGRAPLVGADGLEYAPFYDTAGAGVVGGCNQDQILMKCTMDLRQFGLDRGGGFWMNMEPLCRGDAREALTECAARRAWIAAPQDAARPFTAQEVKMQVRRALWALKVLDPRVADCMGEIYSVERRPGEALWFPVFLADADLSSAELSAQL